MHYVTFHFLKHPKWFITAISLLWSWNSTPLFERKLSVAMFHQFFSADATSRLASLADSTIRGCCSATKLHISHLTRKQIKLLPRSTTFDALRYTRADFELLRLVSARIDCEYSSRNYKEQHRKKKLLWTFTQHNLNAAFNRSSKWRLKNLSRLMKLKAENYFPSGFHLASDGGEKIHNEKN